MQRIRSPAGATISYDQYGSGPPLVLVHGAFSDHQTNWAFVKPLFEEQFTVYAVARRGRGETDATAGHSLEDESRDVVAVIQAIGAPVFLLGHSYGADHKPGHAQPCTVRFHVSELLSAFLLLPHLGHQPVLIEATPQLD